MDKLPIDSFSNNKVGNALIQILAAFLKCELCNSDTIECVREDEKYTNCFLFPNIQTSVI